MNRRFLPLLVALLLVTPAFAGTPDPVVAPEPSNNGDWCDLLQDSLGLKTKGWEPWLFDLKMFGRFQWQAAYVDGVDGNNEDFSYNTTEVRRVYLGGEAKFLNYFKAKGRAVLARDNHPRGGDLDWQYTHLWDLGFFFDLKKAFSMEDLGALAVAYGKKQVNVSDEWHVSSRYLKTIERSAIANYVWPYTAGFSNPTGAWMSAKREAWSGTLGIFTTSHSNEFASWDDGTMIYGETTWKNPESGGWSPVSVNFAGFYQSADLGQERLGGGIEWAASLASLHKGDRWECRANLILGDNGDQVDPERKGLFGGVVILPSYWLLEEKLELVGRYQFQAAEKDQGIRLWSRYARRADAAGNADLINGGRGDRHHNIYAGLNYYFCSDNLKVMGGVEYDDIASGGEDVYKGWTSTVAFRFFF